jgi:RNA ligase
MITIDSLIKLEKEGLITLKPNQEKKLFIANYTSIVQFDRIWTDTLLKCRGLIIDINGQIVARPFPKFFNLEEHSREELPVESFEVFEKLDGSLGILYYDKNWKIATRNSFYSEQAEIATKLLYSKYNQFIEMFERDKTYLFEIIYPSNRIVVNYGNKESLVLLAIIDTNTGKEYSIDSFDFPEKVKRYEGIKDINKIREFENKEEEGFVIKFNSGFRVKVKFEEYLRLHKIFTQVTSKTIWDCLRQKKSLNEILEKVPDEFYEWVKHQRKGLEEEYEKTYLTIQRKFDNRPVFRTRKEFAFWAIKQENQGLLFDLLDGKSIEKKIWNLIEPEYKRPFRNIE